MVADGAPNASDASQARDARPGTESEIHFIGRFDWSDPSGPLFSWPGSAIVTRFDGTGLSVRLDDDGSSDRFEVTIDGAAQPVLSASPGPNTYVIASGLAPGMHDVTITKRTEALFGTTRFLGFSGSPLVATAGPTRFIEMVGDSITCGFGVLGDGPDCPFTPETEDETSAWGALAARALDAAHATIAHSGLGVYRNGDGATDPLMPKLFKLTLPLDPTSTWGFSDYTPDVVVINLGTNDFAMGDPGQGFVDAMSAFVTAIRGYYPDAWILLSTSPMLAGADHSKHRGYLEQVIAAQMDPKVVLLDVAAQDPGDGYGCLDHPNTITQQKMADTLVAKVRELTGW